MTEHWRGESTETELQITAEPLDILKRTDQHMHLRKLQKEGRKGIKHSKGLEETIPRADTEPGRVPISTAKVEPFMIMGIS